MKSLFCSPVDSGQEFVMSKATVCDVLGVQVTVPQTKCEYVKIFKQ